MNFREKLKNWVDIDFAAYYLGIQLGLMPDEPGFGRAKHVFWSRHVVGEALVESLNQLKIAGILEFNEEEMQYRWNSEFKGSWEDVTPKKND